MYERTLADKTILSFGHEGLLYEDSFVMYDRDTKSLWVHVTGEAIKGPLKGTKLRFFPSTLTTWKSWKAQYPDTLVLPGETTGGFMGTFQGLGKGRRGPLGLAVFVPGAVKLYPMEALSSKKLIEDSIDGHDIVVTFSKASGIARAFSRSLEGELFDFELVEDEEGGSLTLEDEGTATLWNGLTGTAFEGDWEGESLTPLVSYAILVDRYRAFFPDGLLFEKTNKPQGKKPSKKESNSSAEGS